MFVETKINLEISQIAKIIKNLKDDELEELEMILSGETKEIKRRLNLVKTKKAKLLTKEEVFDGI